MNKSLTFDDVLILPQFSHINSRKDVDLSTNLGPIALRLPIVSSNMSTITEEDMAIAMDKAGGLGILHRFCTIEDNIKMFNKVYDLKLGIRKGISIGVGSNEFERAEALIHAGANIICIDVAHGAQMSVVKQYDQLRDKYGDDIVVIVGNFATRKSIQDFKSNSSQNDWSGPDVFKVGIGPGSVCTTRIKTGIGVPQLSAIMDCASEYPVMADGGCRNPSDIAKALAAGAKTIMIGGMLAGTNETPGELFNKKYSGSAYKEVYNGDSTSEGIVTKVNNKGPVNVILNDIEGGLRSALTYTNSKTLKEFRSNAKFLEISSNTVIENNPHILYNKVNNE